MYSNTNFNHLRIAFRQKKQQKNNLVIMSCLKNMGGIQVTPVRRGSQEYIPLLNWQWQSTDGIHEGVEGDGHALSLV